MEMLFMDKRAINRDNRGGTTMSNLNDQKSRHHCLETQTHVFEW